MTTDLTPSQRHPILFEIFYLFVICTPLIAFAGLHSPAARHWYVVGGAVTVLVWVVTVPKLCRSHLAGMFGVALFWPILLLAIVVIGIQGRLGELNQP